MQKNELFKNQDKIIRILFIEEDLILTIDCVKCSMPIWMKLEKLAQYSPCSEEGLFNFTGVVIPDLSCVSAEDKKVMHQRYTMIAGIIPFVNNKSIRNRLISEIANNENISKQTIRNYLCKYLAYQKIEVLLPKQINTEQCLSEAQKNIRWALNKYFYTKNAYSLKTAYMLMLRDKYCDDSGKLLEDYPSFYQFRYYYRTNKKMQTYYISRQGIKCYQRNFRPLLGDGVQSYAPDIGTGMLDATICDIYLVNDAGQLVGRPVLVACIDANTSMCCGYSLLWEGGMYSLKNLMLNIITDKVSWCKSFGIKINKEQWNCNRLPARFITDMGSEYKSDTFSQIADLGVTIVNLPAYRPELKGSVEKFFDLIQDLYKPHLKGLGVIEPDFQERGAHDYRKDACLTLNDFEKIILRCIIYYNSERILENYPYTHDMLDNQIHPYANSIWNWKLQHKQSNLISCSKEELSMALLPRTTGKFSRFGLRVNKLRYKNTDYVEEYLQCETVPVAYDPDDVSMVWMINQGKYIPFKLIESRFDKLSLGDVESANVSLNSMISDAHSHNNQAQIDLINHINAVSNEKQRFSGNIQIKNIRNTRKKERIKHRMSVQQED